MATLEKITRKEAKEMIDSSLVCLITSKTDSIVNAINSDLQVRDYLLGLPNDYSLNTLINYIDQLIEHTPRDNTYALLTIRAIYKFEADGIDKGKSDLSEALSINKEYSLAKLTYKVFEANWPINTFATMRQELAHKVIAELDDTIIE